MFVATQHSSVEYVLQTESYKIMVSYNTTNVSPLCHTSKARACLVSAFEYQFRFLVQQVISSVGNNLSGHFYSPQFVG